MYEQQKKLRLSATLIDDRMWSETGRTRQGSEYVGTVLRLEGRGGVRVRLDKNGELTISPEGGGEDAWIIRTRLPLPIQAEACQSAT